VADDGGRHLSGSRDEPPHPASGWANREVGRAVPPGSLASARLQTDGWV